LGNRQGGRERGVTQVSLFLFQMKKEQIKRGGKQGVQQLFPGIAGSGEVGKVEPKKAETPRPPPIHFSSALCALAISFFWSCFLYLLIVISSRCNTVVMFFQGRTYFWAQAAGFELLTCFAFFPSLAVAVCRAPTFRFLGIPLLPSESSLPLTPLATNSCFIPLLLLAGARVEAAPA